ncbi:hypothetical protein N864_22530 [Intrasporangium chromatireducens Q5-1]|uniref:Uncharacterized protein n=1 Tax=Intrasporangium chromatireducens Q5-1 TaxID=584657 RepID=W9GR06_9MICO|nr:hypothetical protein [Intrasporangium chromatireducens]EWT06319.1 hypothetical protein N864_22530 [Intrasporangium chromatireducens Q5-1]
MMMPAPKTSGWRMVNSAEHHAPSESRIGVEQHLDDSRDEAKRPVPQSWSAEHDKDEHRHGHDSDDDNHSRIGELLRNLSDRDRRQERI